MYASLFTTVVLVLFPTAFRMMSVEEYIFPKIGAYHIYERHEVYLQGVYLPKDPCIYTGVIETVGNLGLLGLTPKINRSVYA